MACLNPAAAQRWYGSMHVSTENALEVEKRIQLFITKYIVPFMDDRGYSDPAVDGLILVPVYDGLINGSVRKKCLR